MVPAKFVHRRVDHGELGGVAVHNGHLPAVLDEVADDFGGSGHSLLLLGKVGSQGVVAQSDHKSFFCHIHIPLFLVFLKGFNNTNYSGGGEKKQERSWKDGCHMV